MAAALLLGVVAIRRRDVTAHRAWMTGPTPSRLPPGPRPSPRVRVRPCSGTAPLRSTPPGPRPGSSTWPWPSGRSAAAVPLGVAADGGSWPGSADHEHLLRVPGSRGTSTSTGRASSTASPCGTPLTGRRRSLGRCATRPSSMDSWHASATSAPHCCRCGRYLTGVASRGVRCLGSTGPGPPSVSSCGPRSPGTPTRRGVSVAWSR